MTFSKMALNRMYFKIGRVNDALGNHCRVCIHHNERSQRQLNAFIVFQGSVNHSKSYLASTRHYLIIMPISIGQMTLSRMTLSIMALNKMTLSRIILGRQILSRITFSRMTIN
jgi:hypothetical protein